MKVLVLAEYYPRSGDPGQGVWAHRQTLAAREAGADVRVLVLHRPLPPIAAVRGLDFARALNVVSQPSSAVLDGLRVDYVRYLSPPRRWTYRSWGAWAAPVLARRLERLRRDFAVDLVHAHYAVPAGDAIRRVAPELPLVVSVHGGDVLGPHASSSAVRTTLGHARLVLANSAGTARRCEAHGARSTRVVHLGGDPPSASAPHSATPTLVTVADLIARKRQGDVIAALAGLRARHPDLRYVLVGDGPERERLRARAIELGVADRVDFRGRLAHAEAVALARSAALFVLPSVAEAFGVAYVEAMGGGVPAIGSRGEEGPEEIAAAGGGIALVPPGDVTALANQIDMLLSDPAAREALGRQARETVEREFTWEKCGRETVQAYEQALEKG